MSGAPVYELQGLRVRSEVPLVADEVVSPETCDLEVRVGTARTVPMVDPDGDRVASFATGETVYYVITASEAGFVVRVPTVCDFDLSTDLTSIVCHPDPAGEEGLIPLLLSGLVVAFVLAARGDAVLHASAVEVDGSAIAVGGQSGAGKSTIAALLCAAGARLVTDDVLRLGRGQRTINCIGGTVSLRLRPTADWVINRFPEAPRSSQTVDGRTRVQPPVTTSAHTPLRAIVLPQPARSTGAVVLERLRGATAALELVKVTRVIGWEREFAAANLASVSDVARNVPTYRAVFPSAQDHADAIVTALVALARSAS